MSGVLILAYHHDVVTYRGQSKVSKPLYEDWGRRIIEARKARGWSQKELASRCKVDQTAVTKWERGISAPSEPNKVRIAQVLEIDARDLFPLPTRLPRARKAKNP